MRELYGPFDDVTAQAVGDGDPQVVQRIAEVDLERVAVHRRSGVLPLGATDRVVTDGERGPHEAGAAVHGVLLTPIER